MNFWPKIKKFFNSLISAEEKYHLFDYKDVPVRMERRILTFLVLIFVLASISDWSLVTGVNYTLVLSIVYFTSVLFHELAHCHYALKYGYGVKNVHLTVYGGLTSIKGDGISKSNKNRIEKFFIFSSGPTINLWLFLVFIFFPLFILTGEGYLSNGFTILGVINFLLFLANMIPVFPLDGGRISELFISSWLSTDETVANEEQVVKYGSVLSIFVCLTIGAFTFITYPFVTIFLAFGVFLNSVRFLGSSNISSFEI